MRCEIPSFAKIHKEEIMQTHKKILKLPWFWREPRGGIEETLDENYQFRSVQYMIILWHKFRDRLHDLEASK